MEAIANQVMRHNYQGERIASERKHAVGPEDSLVDNVGG